MKPGRREWIVSKKAGKASGARKAAAPKGAEILSARADSALGAKIAGRVRDEAEQDLLTSKGLALESLSATTSYENTPKGQFENLQSIRLRWVRSDRQKDWFEFIPRIQSPFAFVRANGQRITPRRMFTDGGSVPRPLWGLRGFSPWGCAPAFLVHDYQFDAHHCRQGNASFDEVRDTMMEAVKTLMARGLVEQDKAVFQLIRAGISSKIARKAWDRVYVTCPLPPDSAE